MLLNAPVKKEEGSRANMFIGPDVAPKNHVHNALWYPTEWSAAKRFGLLVTLRGNIQLFPIAIDAVKTEWFRSVRPGRSLNAYALSS